MKKLTILMGCAALIALAACSKQDQASADAAPAAADAVVAPAAPAADDAAAPAADAKAA
jgi:hypothetical protein